MTVEEMVRKVLAAAIKEELVKGWPSTHPENFSAGDMVMTAEVLRELIRNSQLEAVEYTVKQIAKNFADRGLCLSDWVSESAVDWEKVLREAVE